MVRKFLVGRGAFLRMFSGALAVQAMLSASSLIVGLLLVRRTSGAQYGYYILITTTVLLSTSLQAAFIVPPMIIRLTNASGPQQRADLIGGLYRDQRRLVPWLAVITLVLALVLRSRGLLDLPLTITLTAATAAVITALQREFLRNVLFAYRRPHDVLRSDFFYCVVFVAGAAVATFSPLPAATTACGIALACILGTAFLSRALRRHEPWNPRAPLGMLREIAPVGAWSALGSGVYWLFSQGYNYLVAGTLDVTAVAALAATRLLVMPVNLLSTGTGTLLLPTVSRWLQGCTLPQVLKRLALFSLGLSSLACCYLLVTWLGREWIFRVVLKKSFAERDSLLLLWCAISVAMIFRDQLLHFMTARARFRLMFWLTLASAVIAISISAVALRRVGVAGALIGLLAGELFNVAGIIVLSIRDARRPASLQPLRAAASTP